MFCRIQQSSLKAIQNSFEQDGSDVKGKKDLIQTDSTCNVSRKLGSQASDYNYASGYDLVAIVKSYSDFLSLRGRIHMLHFAANFPSWVLTASASTDSNRIIIIQEKSRNA